MIPPQDDPLVAGHGLIASLAMTIRTGHKLVPADESRGE